MAPTLSPSPAAETSPLPAKPEPPRRRLPRRVWVLPLVLALLGAGWTTWYLLCRPQGEGLALSGRIEGDEANIGTKVAGRVEAVTVREGDPVRRGQVIVELDEAELEAQLQGAIARINAAQQQVRQAQLQEEVIASQIQEVQLSLQRAQGESLGQVREAAARVAAAEAQLNQAQAQVAEAQANLTLAREDRDRYAQLLQQGVVSAQRFQQAQTTFVTAQATLQARQAAVAAAQKQVAAAQGALAQAETTALNPEIFQAQLQRLQTQQAQAQAQLEAAIAEVNNAEATRGEIQARLDNLTVVSPMDGVVITRNVEPGEVVSPGRALLSVVNLNQVYLRGFVPAGQIGLVRVGQPAQVFLDSAPDQPLAAKVIAIDPQASFTPESVYFREDRVQQVFGVKLGIEHPAGFAKPGMPADGLILMEPMDQ